MAGRTGYSGLQIALHWAVAGLIAANWLLSEGMGRYLDQRLEGQPVTDTLPNAHVYAGIAILVLAVIRLAVRLWQGGPAAVLPRSLVDRVAGWTHGMLYLLIFVVPLAGMAAWFGGVEAAGEAHELLMNLMMVLVVLHVLGALYHQFVVRDGVLTRMLRPD
ncbi:MAG TPA: cytochrome b/b6 domain-containing protein [Paracoccaceae bacterium]|nr:cytochrome b/b6 domain-containing protein [Paracoccaceae bacterium]